ncbi:AcrR family transcriptional regulator [Marmoricola sp. URHA0025 HA25]
MPTASDEGLSRAMRELWGLADSGRRGPKPAMSVRAIAAAGVALADSEGVDAVTMAAVAQRLGFTTMSLYRYVESREDLLSAMVDAALGAPPAQNRRWGWRRQVEEWARAEGSQLLAHPWVLDVRTSTPPIGPNVMAWMEQGFAALAASGLALAPAADALLIIDGYVRSNVRLTLQYGTPGATESWVTQLGAVLDADRFPTVHAVFMSGAFEDGSYREAQGRDFEFGLSLLLDGLQRLIRS